MMEQPRLGIKITELRKQKGLTQEELVEQCNISVRTLQRIESGSVTPRVYTIRLICDVLGFDYSSVMLDEIQSTNGDTSSNKEGVKSQKVKFNYKNEEIMKKSLLILSIALIILAISLYAMYSQKYPNGKSQDLAGGWKLVGEYKNDTLVKAKNYRFVEFYECNLFASYMPNGSVYNSGKYNIIGGNAFITQHFGYKTANQYDYSISNDTLTFTGYFLIPTGRNTYRSALISEIWVRADVPSNFRENVDEFQLTKYSAALKE